MKIVAIRTGLFPDAKTVEAALAKLAGAHSVAWIDATRDDLGDADWDAALVAILAADLVFSC